MNEIYQVIPTDDYKVYLYFEDGKIKLFDITMIKLTGVFEPLNDIEVFKDTCTVLNGTLAWSLDKSYNRETCIDLDADVLYNKCATVDEPWYLFKGLNPNSLCPKCNKKYDGYYCNNCGYCKDDSMGSELDIF